MSGMRRVCLLTSGAEQGSLHSPSSSVTNKAALLHGVSETLLVALHNRAWETMLPDGVLNDPAALGAYVALDADFDQFAEPDGFHGARAVIVDGVVSTWLDANPDGAIVELGAGLETQNVRVAAQCPWLCVDLPEAIAVRDELLPAHGEVRHLAADVTTHVWLDAVPAGRPVLITAQGLLMYLPPPAVRRLFVQTANALPGVTWVFDTIAPNTQPTSDERTATGYVRPEMPWSARASVVASTLKSWVPGATVHSVVPFGPVRGAAGERWADARQDSALIDAHGAHVVHATLPG